MARPKKNLKQELEETLQEEIDETPIVNVVSVASANANHKADLEARLVYLRELRGKIEAEGVNSLGSLDVIISKVIQELGTL